jgi:hypothetical protein
MQPATSVDADEQLVAMSVGMISPDLPWRDSMNPEAPLRHERKHPGKLENREISADGVVGAGQFEAPHTA